MYFKLQESKHILQTFYLQIWIVHNSYLPVQSIAWGIDVIG